MREAVFMLTAVARLSLKGLAAALLEHACPFAYHLSTQMPTEDLLWRD
jgi:hypothetical protein